MGIVSALFLVVAVRQVRRSGADNAVPLMGVMGAFVFAAQMINFTIPGTGSSGHIVGGVLLSVLLGPWAGLIVLASVLVIQCLVFGDGGLLALGCNLFNMAVCTCLIAYPLVYRPFVRPDSTAARIVWGAVSACVVGLLLGAFAVSLETAASGVTALPFREFLLFMLPIHLLIGIGEGLATASVLCFVRRYRPDLLAWQSGTSSRDVKSLWVFSFLALLMALSFGWVASVLPDGLEWSVQQVAGGEDAHAIPVAGVDVVGDVHENMVLMPEYDHMLAGVLGCLLVVFLVWMVSWIFRHSHLKAR